MKELREAARKLRLAYELNTSVYMYGATGYGKTFLAQSVLPKRGITWYSCADPTEELLSRLEQNTPGEYLVIDDLQLLEDPAVKHAIARRIESGSCWIALIGRMRPPEWIMSLMLKTRLILITEEDLYLTPAEVNEMALAAGVTLSDEDVRYLQESSWGNALVLNYSLRRAASGEKIGPEQKASVLNVFRQYLYSNIICQWSTAMQEFLTELCVVDEFDLQLAEEITGDDQSMALLKAAMEMGNFLSCTDGIWRMHPVLIDALRERALELLGRRHYEHCLYNAARYYELHDELLRALEFYEACGDRDSIRKLLMRNALRQPGAGWYYEMRRYYMDLPEEEIRTSPVLMYAMGLLYSMLMDKERSEYWYEALSEYAQTAKGTQRAEAQTQLVRLEFSMPHRGSGNILHMLRAASLVMRSTGVGLMPLSVTNNQPSLMSGGLDFCEWSRRDTFLADSVGPMVEKVLGTTGVGLVHTALGESFYEKNADSFLTISHLTRAQNECGSRGTLEMSFVATALLAKLSAYTGDWELADQTAAGIEKRVCQEQAKRMYSSVRAFRCRLSLLKNDQAAIAAWMAQAPDESAEFCTLLRYLYTTKIRCYLAQGMPMPALMLAERMIDYAEYCKRTYIRMECGLLRAIAQKRLGMQWQEDLIAVLMKIRTYKFVRMISELGAAIVPLLEEVRPKFADKEEKGWFETVRREAGNVAGRYPNYLRGNSVDLSEFSETALAVLRLQAAGFNTRQIAEQLFISQSTVKYHARENYRKLGARDMVEAVKIAADMHIL